MRQTFVYSEAFKLRVLRAVESGEVSSITAAQEVFGIRGNNTIKKWAIKYGKDHLLGKVIRVQTPKETSELQMLRKRVRELEKALANKTIDCLMGEAYLQIACEMAQVSDVEAFKKKHAGKL